MTQQPDVPPTCEPTPWEKPELQELAMRHTQNNPTGIILDDSFDVQS